LDRGAVDLPITYTYLRKKRRPRLAESFFMTAHDQRLLLLAEDGRAVPLRDRHACCVLIGLVVAVSIP
jgi:hypothetical protein